MQSITINTASTPVPSMSVMQGINHQQQMNPMASSILQQQLFALATATAAANQAQIVSTTRVEILGQHGPIKLLRRISPFLNQTVFNCRRVAIDREPQTKENTSSSVSTVFPPENVWTSFCDDIDKELRIVNLAKSLSSSGIFLLVLIEIILFALMGFGGITFDLYAYFLPFVPILILAVKVRYMTLKAVKQVRELCDVYSRNSDGKFRYALGEEVIWRGTRENMTHIKTYYIMISGMDPNNNIISNAAAGILGNMEMGETLTGGAATNNSNNTYPTSYE